MKKYNSSLNLIISAACLFVFAAILFFLIKIDKTDISSASSNGNTAVEQDKTSSSTPTKGKKDGGLSPASEAKREQYQSGDMNGQISDDANAQEQETPSSKPEEEAVSQPDDANVQEEEPSSYEPEKKEEKATEIPQVSMSSIESVYASSWLAEPEYGIYHTTEKLIDGDTSTAWCEDVSGNGIRETVELYFDGEYVVSGMYIWPGYHKSDEMFEKNSTPTRIRLTGDHSETFDLEDAKKRQKLVFDTLMTTDELTIEILKVREGWGYKDTLISEVKLF